LAKISTHANQNNACPGPGPLEVNHLSPSNSCQEGSIRELYYTIHHQRTVFAL
jgi:hypothetical protein